MTDDELPEEFRRLFGAIRADPAATSGTAIDIVVDDQHPDVREYASRAASVLDRADAGD